jgi:putative intracellular protease/amidase
MTRRNALQNDVLKGANRLRNAVAAARGEASRETLLAELEAILRREIAAEKKTPIPCRRKRKREVLRFSWAPCEKLRGLREVAEALGCGAKWTSLDDGRRGLLKAVRKLRASSETVERPSEGIRIAYLPDPIKSQGAPPERYAAAVLESLGERNVAEVCSLSPDDVIRGQLTTDKFDVLLIPGGFAQNTLDALGKVGGERVRAFVRSGGGYVGICAGAYLGCKGWLDVLPECSVVDFEHWCRGRSDDCVLKLREPTELFKARLGEGSLSVVSRYANGPLLRATGSARVAATFASDYTRNVRKKRGDAEELPRGVMPRHASIVLGENGGRVVLISPHLEDGEPAARKLLRACVRWAAKTAPPKDDLPPPDDVYGPIRRAWLACRKSRYEISDIAEDRSNALAALYREDETRRRRAEMTAARASRPSSRASSASPRHRIKGAIRRAASGLRVGGA